MASAVFALVSSTRKDTLGDLISYPNGFVRWFVCIPVIFIRYFPLFQNSLMEPV